MSSSETPALTLTVDEAARLIGCSDDAVYRSLTLGLPHVKVGRYIRIHRAGLETWLAEIALTGATI